MMAHRSRRRTLAALVGVLASVGLTGCSDPFATTSIYTPATGTNTRAGEVDILSAVVVSTQNGSGTLIASLVNNNPADPARLTSVSADSPLVDQVSRARVTIPPEGLIALNDYETRDEVPRIRVRGDFEQGDFVRLSFTFGDGSESTLGLPVVPNDSQYAGLDGPASAEPEPVGSEQSPEKVGG